MVDPLLSIRGLNIDAGDVRLVDDFSLAVQAGERVALVGESGAGKSVTARAVMRLDRKFALSGSIRLGGTELLTLSERSMSQIRGSRIGMVFQDPMSALNPLMTIGAQVAEPLRLAGMSKVESARRAAALLDDLGVVDAQRRMRAYPHEFSGGMRQRVVLALALINEPELLIADEPTTALDVRVQEQVLTLLARVTAERGLATLLITHDLGTVAGFADRVAVMYAGRKVHEDAVEDLFGRPVHPYSAGLLRAVPRLDLTVERLVAIPGNAPPASARPAGCAFHPRCAVALERCLTEQPVQVSVGVGGSVACHLHPASSEGPLR